MPNERDPKLAKPPETDEIPLAMPDEPAEFDLAGLSDPEIPTADFEVTAGVTFELPAPGTEDSQHTVGVSLVDHPELLSHLYVEEVTPVAEAAPVTEVVPIEEPEALEFEIPEAQGASSSSLFGTEEPGALASAADSGVANFEPIEPLQPASGWFDSQQDEDALPAIPLDAIEAHIAGAPTAEYIEGSDIFSSGHIPSATPNSDVSDVIAATAYRQAKSASDEPLAKIHASRSSDVALTFDQPPGGSTVHDASAEADLPVADEEGNGSDSLFGMEGIDSGKLARTPKLPSDEHRRDDADLGSSPAAGVDASSILADLSEPGQRSTGDSSAIRLESPGMQATIRSDSNARQFAHDPTDPDMNLPEVAEGDPTDWRSHSGSDLFADPHQRSEFELMPDAGAVDPFADDLAVDQPSLSTAPSSIFSGGKMPSGSGSGSVPIEQPDGTDSVEFSDHPDLRSADSDSFHALPVGAVDFDMPDSMQDLHPERSMRYQAPEDEDDWASGQTGPMMPLAKPGDSWDAMAPLPATPVQEKPAESKKKDSSMVVEWVADSEMVDEEPAAPKSSPKKLRRKERSAREASRSGGKRGLIGMAFGLLLGVGVSAAAYFSGLLPKEETKATVRNPNSNDQTQPSVTVADAHAALNSGNPVQALKVMEMAGAKTSEDRAALGQARLFARFRELTQTNATMKPDDEAIKQAQTELKAVMDDADAAKTPEGEKTAVKAALHLGLTYELAGNRNEAMKVYYLGKTKFPNSADAFQTALDRLAATAPEDNKTSLRMTPAEAEQLASAVVILLALDGVAPAAPEPAEAGAAFWKAVNFAKALNFDDAIKQITEAKKLHEKRAKLLAGRGLNPLSDPLEQIFPRCCDDLKAYWELRKTLYEHPGVGAAIQKDGVAKTLDALAGAEKRAVDAAKLAAELKTGNEALALEVKAEKDKLAKAEKELLAEKDNALKAEKDAKASLDKQALNFKKDIESVKTEAAKVQAALDSEKVEKAKLADSLKARQSALEALAKEFQAANLLPGKFDDAGLLAAAKSAVARAGSPDLGKLLPSDISAVAGTGLTTGQLLRLAAHVKSAEAATRTIESQLVAVKKEQAAELKKLTDTYAVDLKKAADAAAVAMEKNKTEAAAKLKEAAEQYAADAKKAADLHAREVKSLETEISKEKRRMDDAEKRFKAQFGDALSPAQQLDLWIALLVDLRRTSDVEPALLAASKALKTAEPGSADAAKAQTVTGLALLLKNDVPAAKEMFADARLTPAYVAAKGKGWAAALDQGWAAVLDPAANARWTLAEPGPRKDPLAAARSLDAGITAYKDGRFAAAEKALGDAAAYDINDALAWYYLGATRWALGKTNEAKADFEQGAEREKKRLVPARQIDSAIGAIQGPARDALTAARP